MEKVLNINKPNFIIVGTAKAGTTSLYDILKDHPDIFLPKIKEPHFFSGVNTPASIKTWEEYLTLFGNVKTETLIGEASVSYLASYEKAIPQIKHYLKDPKIIIILRNPIDRAHSDYLMDIRKGTQKKDFQHFIDNPDNIYIQYGYYYNQVKAYIENFTNVKVLFYENINTEVFLNETLSFLDVCNIEELKIAESNVGGRWKYSFISHLNGIYQSNRWLFKIFPSRLKIILKDIFYVQKRTYVDKNVQLKLIAAYRNDIEKLSQLLYVNLEHWLEIK
jgi:hypothetical protein